MRLLQKCSNLNLSKIEIELFISLDENYDEFIRENKQKMSINSEKKGQDPIYY